MSWALAKQPQLEGSPPPETPMSPAGLGALEALVPADALAATRQGAEQLRYLARER